MKDSTKSLGVSYHSTSFPGVRYREHPTRMHGVGRKDRYFFIRYQQDGKRKEEGVGWASDRAKKWTAEKAALVLAELKAAAKSGKAEPVRLSERREAESKRRADEAAEKQQQEKEQITFGQFFEDTYTPAFENGRAKSNARKGKEHFSKWIKPVIGDIPLKDVKPFHIERLKKDVLSSGKAPRTLQYIFATIRQAWNMARRDGMVTGDSPTKGIKIPKIDNRRVRHLSHEQAKVLLGALKDKDPLAHDIALLSLHTGMRAGEILALKWSHIDTGRGIINIMDSKSGKSRVAFMTGEVKGMLEAMTRGKSDAYVFAKDGERLNDTPRIFSEVVGDLGFNDNSPDRRERVCFHTLRHTFASWHVMSGTDIYTVKELLGHSVIAMTERYAHLSKGALHNATSNFERALDKAEAEQVAESAGGENHAKA